MRKARYILSIIVTICFIISWVLYLPFMFEGIVPLFGWEIPQWVVELGAILSLPFIIILLGAGIGWYILDKKIENSYGECACTEREKCCMAEWYERFGYCYCFECEYYKRMSKEQIAECKKRIKTFLSERPDEEPNSGENQN